MKRLKLIATVFIVLALFFVTFPVYAATWASYNDPSLDTPDETFSGNETTVYMRGTGFSTATFYAVGYYDGADARVARHDTWTSTGTLDSQYYFPTDDTAVAGTWHSVVFQTTGAIPGTYTSTLADDNPTIYVVEDSFTVEQSAIPEFPTVITMIVAVGLSFGIYYWTRRRYQRQAVMD